MTTPHVDAPWRADRVWKGLSLIPFVEAFLIPFFSTTYFQPMFSKPPDWLGLSFGLVLDLLLLGWAALGARVIWTTRSAAMATVALLTTTVPATILPIFIPALILIMANLAV